MFDAEQPPLLEDEYEQAVKRGGEDYAKAYTEGLYDGLQLQNSTISKLTDKLSFIQDTLGAVLEDIEK